jgi:hypothetical protein
MALTGVQYIT